MTDAVIVSTARTGIGKAARGSLNLTHGATMGSHVAAAAIERVGIDPALIEDSIWGCGYPEYVTGGNIARQIVIRAGLPVSVAGTTVNRFCASACRRLPWPRIWSGRKARGPCWRVVLNRSAWSSRPLVTHAKPGSRRTNPTSICR